MKYETIIDDVTTREKLINRVEVLDKVKELLLIPRMQFTTIQGVADFYEVEYKAIDSIVRRHKNELSTDGVIKVTRKDVVDCFRQNEENEEDNNILITQPQYIELRINDNYSINIANRGALVFPKRAVLRIGMLLRDSEIAKEVRNQLLNIEEKVAPEVKTIEIDKEKELLERALGAAFINNDIESFIRAIDSLKSYNNRYSKEAYEALQEENMELKAIVSDLGTAIEHLELTNKALSEEISAITTVETYRRVIISMMIRLAEKKKFSTPYLCYQQLYTILRNDYEIDLSGRRYKLTVSERKHKSKIDCIETVDEWNKALKVATAMCIKDSVNIDDLLLQLKDAE